MKVLSGIISLIVRLLTKAYPKLIEGGQASESHIRPDKILSGLLYVRQINVEA